MSYTNFLNTITGKLKVDPNRTDTTQFGLYGTGAVAQAAIGTRHNIDERSFVYGYATELLNPGFGAAFFPQYKGCATATAQAIGDNQITITVTTTAFAKNELVGGYYSQPDGTNKQFRRIIANTAATSGAATTLTLDGPLTRTLAVNSFAELMYNPWSSLGGGVLSTYGGYVTFGGIPTTAIAAGHYGWIQTWGPTWATPETPVADTANWRTVVFQGNGSIRGYDDAVGETGHQVAGYVIDRTGNGSDNPPFIFLTVSR